MQGLGRKLAYLRIGGLGISIYQMKWDLFKNIKDNISTKDVTKHDDVIEDTLKLLLDKSNYEEPLLLSCKLLHDYSKYN